MGAGRGGKGTEHYGERTSDTGGQDQSPPPHDPAAGLPRPPLVLCWAAVWPRAGRCEALQGDF